MQSDEPEAESPDGTWLTKAELAAVRGIALESAERLYRRQGWRRMPGNDGRVRVLVPPDWLGPRGGDPPDEGAESPGDEATDDADNPPDIAPDPGDISNNVRVFESALSALREAKNGEIATLRAACDQALVQVADAKARADAADADRRGERERADRAEQALAGERQRADSLRDRLDAAERGQREAREAAEALRQAEAARRARGLLARLREAWRGEAG